ncbi:hypothetical protein MGA3_14316 [Bacillus methanolicus MGA3]|nr:hypothetical protein MGA3_14316 [Bacillus methanolicus MGA3]
MDIIFILSIKVSQSKGWLLIKLIKIDPATEPEFCGIFLGKLELAHKFPKLAHKS